MLLNAVTIIVLGIGLLAIAGYGVEHSNEVARFLGDLPTQVKNAIPIVGLVAIVMVSFGIHGLAVYFGNRRYLFRKTSVQSQNKSIQRSVVSRFVGFVYSVLLISLTAGLIGAGCWGAYYVYSTSSADIRSQFEKARIAQKQSPRSKTAAEQFVEQRSALRSGAEDYRHDARQFLQLIQNVERLRVKKLTGRDLKYSYEFQPQQSPTFSTDPEWLLGMAYKVGETIEWKARLMKNETGKVSVEVLDLPNTIPGTPSNIVAWEIGVEYSISLDLKETKEVASDSEARITGTLGKPIIIHLWESNHIKGHGVIIPINGVRVSHDVNDKGNVIPLE